MNQITSKLLLSATFGCLLLLATTVPATIVIWSEDFTSVADWQVIFDPGGGSTVTTDGNLGLFTVTNQNDQAAFGPIPGVAPLVPFVVAEQNKYSMSFDVDSVTSSTSYDIRLDEFDANTNYLSTVFSVFPQGTFTGSTNVGLGAFTFNPGAVFLLPKITVFTGNPNQTVSFDSMEFELAVPEPSTVVLLMTGLGVAWYRLRKRPSS